MEGAHWIARDRPFGQGGQGVAQVVPGEAGGSGDGDDRDVRRLRIGATGRVRGVGVDRVAVVEGKGVGEVAVVDRLAVKDSAEDGELDALRPWPGWPRSAPWSRRVRGDQRLAGPYLWRQAVALTSRYSSWRSTQHWCPMDPQRRRASRRRCSGRRACGPHLAECRRSTLAADRIRRGIDDERHQTVPMPGRHCGHGIRGRNLPDVCSVKECGRSFPDPNAVLTFRVRSGDPARAPASARAMGAALRRRRPDQGPSPG